MHEYLKQQKVNTEPPQQHYVLQRRQPRQQYKAILSLPQQLRDSFGLGLHLSKAEIEKLVTYYLLILQVQYPSISGWKSLRSVFAISVGSPWYTQFGARGRIFVDNIVPEDAKSVIACKEGNVVALGNLFESGRASIKDVTSDFRPLLWVSGLPTLNSEDILTLHCTRQIVALLRLSDSSLIEALMRLS